MIFRTKTSKQTMEIFNSFAKSEHLQPFILAKLAISLSIKNDFHYSEELLQDTLGLDLNRQTITGEYDLLYKALIAINEGRNISEEEFFPNMIKAYMDNGAKLLEQEYKYSTDFFIHLVELDKGI